MSILKLHAISAKLSTGINNLEGLNEIDKWILSLTAKLDDRLKVTTGENLEDFLVLVNLKRHPSGVLSPWPVAGYNQKAIGGLHYFASGSPRLIVLEAYIGEAEMTALLQFARHGRFPREISVDVEGIEYDNRDGSVVKWDNAAKAKVPLTAIDFSIPVIDADPADPSKPKTPVGADIVPELRKLAQWQQWTWYLLIALGAILLFRR